MSIKSVARIVAACASLAIPLFAQAALAEGTNSKPEWYSRLAATDPGAFAPPRSFHAGYRVAWSGLEAAHIETDFSAPVDGPQICTEVRANTTGAARALYKLDATHVSRIERTTFHPQSIEQSEHGSRKNFAASVSFNADGAVRTERNLDRKDDLDKSRKIKKYSYPGMLDMEGVLLQFRSLPLANGEEKTYLFMTAGSPYLATLKVVGRESVHVRAGDFPAIQCSLKLEKVGKNGGLEPRKGFKSGYAWLSDDTDRILIKAETDIFIGSVSMELENVRFTDAGR